MKNCTNCNSRVGDLRPACPDCGGRDFTWPDNNASQRDPLADHRPELDDRAGFIDVVNAERNTPPLAELQAAAGRYTTKTTLSGAGAGSVVFGLLGIYLGVTSLHANALNMIPIILGGLLILEGIWISLSSAKVLLVVDGIALVSVGLWNMLASAINSYGSYSHDSAMPWRMLAMAQIGWGIQRFVKYTRVRRAVTTSEPLPEAEQWIEDAVNTVRSGEPDASMILLKGDPDATISMMASSWIVQLREDLAVFVMTFGGSEVLVLPRSQISIVSAKSGRFGVKGKKVTLNLAGRKLKVIVKSLHVGRLKSWIADTPVLTAAASVAPVLRPACMGDVG